ncbi:hypothetical protein Fmac_014336 [Flemingia macrophylla]|uniref:Uncharacterized protein n=1 Tax=Flemingia macrophylla TaxID=520843 RepID=A0ABD1MC60_9FABA
MIRINMPNHVGCWFAEPRQWISYEATNDNFQQPFHYLQQSGSNASPFQLQQQQSRSLSTTAATYLPRHF